MAIARTEEIGRSKLQAKLDLESKKLLDLTLRNKMIKYRPTARAHIDGYAESISDLIAALMDEDGPRPIHLTPLAGNPVHNQSWSLSGGKATFFYVKADDEDPVRRPRNLARESTVFEQEHGYGALFLATGFVEWTEAPGTEPLLAPLLLFPVVISRIGHGEKYAIRATGDEPTINPAIVLKLKEQSLEIPELDDFSADSVAAYVQSLDRILERKAWRVKPKVSLGMFKFHKFVMYKDIQKLSEYIGGGGSITGAIKALLEPDYKSPEMDSQPVLEQADIDLRIDWRKANYVLDADPSQIVAMEQVKAGKNLVLQGPPGTGKSQTIANLIAELLGEGKRVLFVSEKEAALDVVKRRLDQAGLGDFCLALHGLKTTHDKFRDQLAAALDGRYEVPSGRDLDWVQFEQHRTHLSNYAKALAASPEDSDISYFEAMGRTIRLREENEGLTPLNERPRVTQPGRDDLHSVFKLAADRHEWQDEWGPPDRHAWSWMTTAPADRYAGLSRVPADLHQWEAAVETVGARRDEAAHTVARLKAAPISRESPWAWFSQLAPRDTNALKSQLEALCAARSAYSEAAQAWSQISQESEPASEARLVAIYQWTRSLSNARDVPDVTSADQLNSLEKFAKDALVALDDLALHRATIRDVGIDPDASVDAGELATRLESLAQSVFFWLRPAYWRTKREAAALYAQCPVRRRKQLIKELRSLHAYQQHDKQLDTLKQKTQRKALTPENDVDSLLQALKTLSTWVVLVVPLLQESSNQELLASSISSVDRARKVQDSADSLLAAARLLAGDGKQLREVHGKDVPLAPNLDDVQWASALADYWQEHCNCWDAWAAHAAELDQAISELQKQEVELSAIRESLSDVMQGMSSTLGGLPPAKQPSVEPECAARRVARWISENLGHLGPWLQHLDWIDAARESMLPGLVNADAGAGRERFLASIELTMLQPIWEDGMRLPELASFSSARHERIRELFAEMDRHLHEPSRKRLVKELAARVESLVRAKLPATPMGILSYELKKKRKRLPIRKLVHQTLPALGQLKPCFMMSPITVATYLAPEAPPFDVVIFDEASQIKPEDALVCLMRANQMVVVGDSKQLPPTSFFDSQESEEEGEKEGEIEATALESILDECEGLGFPNMMLNWHYRSRHHTLIEGSNESFYGGRLLVFHSPYNDAQALGLRHEYFPDSVYGQGGQAVNRKEAQHIARLAEQHWNKTPNKTLGVAAFSKGQADEIWDQINAINSQPFLDWAMAESDEPFFVKNLENIQGDERDHIIISVGYGRDKTGVFRRRFGPVNQKGGERRLNVLFSRARERCTVVSNFKSSDLKVDDISSHGPRILKSFLVLAETGRWQGSAPPPKEADSDFELAVQAYLEKQGYTVTPQVGCVGYRIDLAVQHPERKGDYAIGIECDGAAYHSSAVARDRDRQRQEVLEKLCWTIHRVWSTEWFHRPKDAKAKLLSAVEAACTAPAKVPGPIPLPSAPAAAAEEETIEPQKEVVVIPTQDSEGTALELCDYKPFELSADGLPIDFDRLDEDMLHSQIIAIVKQEGPVHQDVLIDRVREVNGYSRAGARMRSNIANAIRNSLRQNEIAQRKGFLRFCTESCRPRRRTGSWKAEHLPPPEIDLALVDLVAHAHEIPHDTLKRACVKELGFARLGKDLQALLDVRIKALVRNHYLALTPKGTLKIVADAEKRELLAQKWGIF